VVVDVVHGDEEGAGGTLSLLGGGKDNGGRHPVGNGIKREENTQSTDRHFNPDGPRPT
jgi:hypothetical protein